MPAGGIVAGGFNRRRQMVRGLGTGTPGGGVPPTPPSITAATPAFTVMGWGAGGGAFITNGMAQFQAWRNEGIRAASARMGSNFILGFGSGQDSAGESAAGKSGGQWDYQKAIEGLGVASVNGGATGLGLKKAKDAGIIDEWYLAVKVAQNAGTTSWGGASTTPGPAGYVLSQQIGGAPFGAWTDDARWAAACQAVGQRAAMVRFEGGDGLTFDPEDTPGIKWRTGLGWWKDGGTPAKAYDYGKPTGGLTTPQQDALIEQRGYEFLSAIYAEFPDCNIVIYQLEGIPGSWPVKQGVDVLGRLAYNELPMPHVSFFLKGGLRAHADANSHGRFVIADAWWYRSGTQYSGASTDTALKWDSQGPLAWLSQILPAYVRNQVMPYVCFTPMSWAGTDAWSDSQWAAMGSPAGVAHGGYGNNQETEPLWTQTQEKYRRRGMGGFRVEYCYDGTFDSNAAKGLYAGHSNYSFPAGRYAAWTPSMSPVDNYSNTAPTITAPTISGSGGSRTVQGVAAHPGAGIGYVRGFVYPAGAPVCASMVWNLHGDTPASGLTHDTMDYTMNLTGITPGSYAILEAHSIQEQVKPLVVGPF